MGLNRKSISVHSGSACSTEAFKPSTVLAAMGQEADRSLRVSVGWSTTDRDVQCFEENFADVITTLRALNAPSG
jgi:cysteine desulfurase